jgi:CubicO group peptidase (beta-lactamase class C family)
MTRALAPVFCILVLTLAGRSEELGAPGHVVDYSAVIKQIEADLSQHMADAKVPGAAIGLVADQDLIWAGALGYTDHSRKHKVTPETLFSLQSIAKTYTATAFLKAVDYNLLSLDDSLKKVIPGFTVLSRFGDGEAEKITFRHLLSHWAGLCHEAPVGNNYGEWHCTFDEHVRSISETWLKYPVGTRFRYSNLGFDLAGHALQLRWNKPFARVMDEELLLPLGMRSSTFAASEALDSPNLAKGHIRGREVPRLEVPMIAAGGMYSTVRDMARFISFHLADGRVGGRRLIRAGVLKAMYEPQFLLPGQRAGYGLGINSRPYHGGTLLFHGGGGYGYSTDQRWIPEYKLGVILLTNAQEGDSFVEDVADRALQSMIRAQTGGLPPDEPFPWHGESKVRLKASAVKKLEGTYLIGSQLLTFRVGDERLNLVRGGKTLPLDAHSPTRFSRGNELYEFLLNDRGQPKEVRNYGDNGVSTWVPNDSTHDLPGPDHPRWRPYLGIYWAKSYGRDDEKSVSLRNGHLYWNGQLNLTEYRPGLFFTADGDSVDFHGKTLSFGNRHYTAIGR